MYFALYGKKKLLGIFDDYEKCNLSIEGLTSNNFLKSKDINIVSYHPNTLVKKNNLFLCPSIDIIEDFTSECSTLNLNNVQDDSEHNSEEYDNSENNDNSEEDDIIEEDSEEREKRITNEKKMKSKKEKLNYNIQILKKKKEQLEEKRRTYQIDLDLYKKFKYIKKENENFVIPPMFENKYNIFMVLDNEKNLSLNNFNNVYKKKIDDTNYSKLFSGDGKDRELLEISENDTDADNNNSDNNNE